MPRIGVVTFPGSLDDHDALRAVRIAGAEPVALWHGSDSLDGVDALVGLLHQVRQQLKTLLAQNK